MKENQAQEYDKEGLETLKVISGANKFNQWMYETIRPYCQGKILEIGSGIGNISRYLINHGYDITLSDLQDRYCNILRTKFGNSPNLEDILQIDLTDPDFPNKYKNILAKFDTVFALNVIEHIENDRLAIANCRFLLKKGGTLIILVPAYQSLFNSFDRALGHYRRYTRSALTTVFKNNDLRVIHSRYFNLAGIAGWYVSGKLQKNDTIPGGQMKLFNFLVPVFRVADMLVKNRAGLSVICVGRKP